MAFPCENVSQVKLTIKQIVKNLYKLSNYEQHSADIENLKTDTEQLLTQLENLPLKRLKCKVNKRQKRKYCRKLQKLNNQQSNNNNVESKQNFPINSESISFTVLNKSEEILNLNSKTIRECERFLQTFKLLEQLHLSRGHDSSKTNKFSLKQRKLKSIWNCMLQEKLGEQTADAAIEQQWNELLFGKIETDFFHDKPDLNDFIRKRKIWDSYIHSKFGTSIPIGWVVPCEEVKKEWQQYLSPTTI